MAEAFIYDAVRTPRTKAKLGGGLSDLTPQELMKQLYAAILNRNELDYHAANFNVSEAILGCVTQHGEQAGNVAKSSLLYAGLPRHIAGTTITRYCSSGLDAINLASLKLLAGQAEAVFAGGVEMMSRQPMLSDQARIFADPEFAAACHILLMGSGADLIATLNGVSREQADEVAYTSQRRATHAQKHGYFKSIVTIENAVTGSLIEEDECIRPSTSLYSLAALPAAFVELGEQGADQHQLAAYSELAHIDHIHTAGNSPAMADGAALTLLANAEFGKHHDLHPRAKIICATSTDDDPLQVVGGCVGATQKLLQDNQLQAADVDLFEIHEAFAATMVKAKRELGIDDGRLNVNGGVIALGHPMGATGAMMVGTLLDELERRDARLGVVATSGAAGSGTAMLIERI